MIDLKAQFEDDISAGLIAVQSLLANPKPVMEEMGQLMVTWIREAHDAGVGLQRKVKYKPLSPKYAKAKANAGGNPNRILHGPSPRSDGQGGSLLASWGVRHVTKSVVAVGAKGSTLEQIKASAHDGGLAEYLGKPSLNRLKLGWNKGTHKRVCNNWMDAMAEAFGS